MQSETVLLPRERRGRLLFQAIQRIAIHDVKRNNVVPRPSQGLPWQRRGRL